MAEPLVWIDGRIVSASDASVPALDQVSLVGDGVFETMRVIGGHVRLLHRHLARLSAACTALGLEIPNLSLIRTAIDRLIFESRIVDGRMRMSVSGGVAGLGPGRGRTPTVVIAIGDAFVPTRPARLLRGHWIRNERSPLAGVKSTSWAENAALLRLAAAGGYDDVLLSDSRGRLSECAAANVFVVLDDQVLTPRLDSGCLPGVVREELLVAGLAAESLIDEADLARVTEAFITSSFVGVRPVASIGSGELPVVDGDSTQRCALWVEQLSR